MNFLVLKHTACEGLGLWEACCQEKDITVETVALHRGAPLPPLHDFQAVISLGGPMNVYEEGRYSLLRTEDALLRQVVEGGIPFLGICLGGQLLAKAVGGTVTRNPVKEIGWHAVSLDRPGLRDPLFAGVPERFTVFQWHRDTFSIPGRGVRLATSPACENQAFRFGFGGVAYALQFHLEVTPPVIADWVREYGGELAALGEEVDVERMLADAPTRCENLGCVSRRVFRNFCHLVELRYAGVGPAAPTEPPRQPARRASRRNPTVVEARQQYRELMAKGKLRCGVTCPLDRIGRCTGGCW